MWSPRVLVAVGFLMLLLTSLQGWGMVGIIAFVDERQSQPLLHAVAPSYSSAKRSSAASAHWSWAAIGFSFLVWLGMKRMTKLFLSPESISFRTR